MLVLANVAECNADGLAMVARVSIQQIGCRCGRLADGCRAVHRHAFETTRRGTEQMPAVSKAPQVRAVAPLTLWASGQATPRCP